MQKISQILNTLLNGKICAPLNNDLGHAHRKFIAKAVFYSMPNCLATSQSSLYHSSPKRRVSGSFKNW